MQIWALTFAEYDFEIIYRPGRYNQLADWLTRDAGHTTSPDESRLDIPDIPR
jgi:hypothetical protein